MTINFLLSVLKRKQETSYCNPSCFVVVVVVVAVVFPFIIHVYLFKFEKYDISMNPQSQHSRYMNRGSLLFLKRHTGPSALIGSQDWSSLVHETTSGEVQISWQYQLNPFVSLFCGLLLLRVFFLFLRKQAIFFCFCFLLWIDKFSGSNYSTMGYMKMIVHHCIFKRCKKYHALTQKMVLQHSIPGP